MDTIGTHTRRLVGPSMSLAAVAAMDLVASAAASPVDNGPVSNYWSPGLVACGLMAAVAMIGGAFCSKAEQGSMVPARLSDLVSVPLVSLCVGGFQGVNWPVMLLRFEFPVADSDVPIEMEPRGHF